MRQTNLTNLESLNKFNYDSKLFETSEIYQSSYGYCLLNFHSCFCTCPLTCNTQIVLRSVYISLDTSISYILRHYTQWCIAIRWQIKVICPRRTEVLFISFVIFFQIFWVGGLMYLIFLILLSVKSLLL